MGYEGGVSTSIREQLDQAWKRLAPLKPVPPDDPNGWYVDLSDVRGPVSAVEQLVRTIRRQADRPQRVLILGHSGCGKSTELRRLQRRLEDEGYRCVLLDVDQELNREDLDIVEMQVLLVEQVGRLLQDVGLKSSDEILQRLREWFSEEEIVTQSERSRGATTNTGTALMQQVFGDLLPSVKAEFRVNESQRRTFREKVRRRLRDFVELTRELVAEANGLLQQNDFRGLVILIDGVEKAALSSDGLSRVKRILIEQVEQWALLPVTQVFSAPLQLLAENTRLQSHYDKFYLIPSVPIADRPDHSSETQPDFVRAGREGLTRLVSRRIDRSVIFKDEDVFAMLLDQSGGSVRDLFGLIREAIDAAGDQPISREDAERAVRVHQIQMELAVQPEDVAPLRALVEDAEALHYDGTGIRLLQKELALHYINGGSWFGVHPAIRRRIQTRQP